MTKPITGVAMMQLYEQGKWKLDDPVAKYIPEFANLQVKKAGGGTEPMKSPMTMAQLMSHSGRLRGELRSTKAPNSLATEPAGHDRQAEDAAARNATRHGVGLRSRASTFRAISSKSSRVSRSMCISMSTSSNHSAWSIPAFGSPAEKANRVVAVHTYDRDRQNHRAAECTRHDEQTQLPFGSGGLMSTVEDYWRFAQAIGEWRRARWQAHPQGGHRQADAHERAEARCESRSVRPEHGRHRLRHGLRGRHGSESREHTQGLNSFYWGGAFGTWFWIDPTNDLVFVGMIQNLNGSRPDAGTPPVRNISVEKTFRALTARSQ